MKENVRHRTMINLWNATGTYLRTVASPNVERLISLRSCIVGHSIRHWGGAQLVLCVFDLLTESRSNTGACVSCCIDKIQVVDCWGKIEKLARLVRCAHADDLFPSHRHTHTQNFTVRHVNHALDHSSTFDTHTHYAGARTRLINCYEIAHHSHVYNYLYYIEQKPEAFRTVNAQKNVKLAWEGVRLHLASVGRGYYPRQMFQAADACRWVLAHDGPKILYFDAPCFLCVVFVFSAIFSWLADFPFLFLNSFRFTNSD